jgi:ABC-type transporter Mla maintaining outer membrane lipid asymmetry ATPase subunit MlaF
VTGAEPSPRSFWQTDRSRAGSLPWPGTVSVEDADWFFGRETLTNALLRLLAERCLCGGAIVVGPSGSGKSSLLRAGPLAALSRGEVTCQVRKNGRGYYLHLASIRARTGFEARREGQDRT